MPAHGRRPSTFFRLVTFLVLLSPFGVWAQREKLPPEDLAIVRERYPNAVRTSTGLRTEVLSPGHGPKPEPGQSVTVIYKGYLLDGTVFEERLEPDKAFTFRLGRNAVIDGWEEGLKLMQVGERRRLIIPFELGYGTRGQPPRIPRRATLIFDVELVAIPPEQDPGAK